MQVQREHELVVDGPRLYSLYLWLQRFSAVLGVTKLDALSNQQVYEAVIVVRLTEEVRPVVESIGESTCKDQIKMNCLFEVIWS